MSKNEFRCKDCGQLQFKYKLEGNKLLVEVKCYNDNTFNYFTVNLNQLNKKENEKSSK